jgi:hypothetical protein
MAWAELSQIERGITACSGLLRYKLAVSREDKFPGPPVWQSRLPSLHLNPSPAPPNVARTTHNVICHELLALSKLETRLALPTRSPV